MHVNEEFQWLDLDNRQKNVKSLLKYIQQKGCSITATLDIRFSSLLFPFSSGSLAHEVHHPVNCMLYLGDCIIYFYSWKVLLQIHALSFTFPSVLQRFPSVCLIVILPFLSDKMTVAHHWSRVWWDACPGPYDVRGSPLFPKSTLISNLYWNLFSSSKPCKWDIPLIYPSNNQF